MFSNTENDAHFPEIFIVEPGQEIYRIVVIYVLVVITVHMVGDVESSAHAEYIRNPVRMTKCEIYRLVSAKAAAGYGYFVLLRFLRQLFLPPLPE
jgi:hypothetical protein